MGWNQPILVLGDYQLTLWHLLSAALALGLAIVLSRLVRRALMEFARHRPAIKAGHLHTVSRILHYLLLGVGLAVALSMLGLSFDKLALIAGALGVGIGFGLQNIVNNFISGVIILFEHTLKVGDFVELESGVFGEVQDISFRSTLIRTNDNVDIIVPNAEFIAGRVTNWTLTEGVCRLRVPFGVAYGSDKERVRDAVLEAAHSVSHTLIGEGRVPQVLMRGFGDSSLDFELVVWVTEAAVKRPGQARSDYLWAIDDRFRREGIEIPFPQRDLHLRSGWMSDSIESKRD